MEDEQMDGPLGTMVTAIAWVSRGFARPILDAYEPDEKVVQKH